MVSTGWLSFSVLTTFDSILISTTPSGQKSLTCIDAGQDDTRSGCVASCGHIVASSIGNAARLPADVPGASSPDDGEKP